MFPHVYVYSCITVMQQKNKRTIWTWVSSKHKKGSFVWRFCAAFCAFCRLSGECIFRETSTKGTNNADIFSRWLTRPLCSSSGLSNRLHGFCWLCHSLGSRQLSSALSKADSSPLPSVDNCSLRVPLSTAPSLLSHLPFLVHFRSRRRFRAQALCLCFAPNQRYRLPLCHTEGLIRSC